MREPIDYPDFIVRFYDVIYKQLRSHVDETYFLSQIAKFGGKALEIGAGTGRLFSQALKDGADIYGLDVNSKMIAKAKEKIAPEHHHRLYVQDAVTMQIPHRFALILAPFRVFSHIIDVEDQIRLPEPCSRASRARRPVYIRPVCSRSEHFEERHTGAGGFRR